MADKCFGFINLQNHKKKCRLIFISFLYMANDVKTFVINRSPSNFLKEKIKTKKLDASSPFLV